MANLPQAGLQGLNYANHPALSKDLYSIAAVIHPNVQALDNINKNAL